MKNKPKFPYVQNDPSVVCQTTEHIIKAGDEILIDYGWDTDGMQFLIKAAEYKDYSEAYKKWSENASKLNDIKNKKGRPRNLITINLMAVEKIKNCQGIIISLNEFKFKLNKYSFYQALTDFLYLMINLYTDAICKSAQIFLLLETSFESFSPTSSHASRNTMLVAVVLVCSTSVAADKCCIINWHITFILDNRHRSTWSDKSSGVNKRKGRTIDRNPNKA